MSAEVIFSARKAAIWGVLGGKKLFVIVTLLSCRKLVVL